jgi:hypothetical protein
MLFGKFGLPGPTRTANLQIRSLLLCPVELREDITSKLERNKGFKPLLKDWKSFVLSLHQFRLTCVLYDIYSKVSTTILVPQQDLLKSW